MADLAHDFDNNGREQDLTSNFPEFEAWLGSLEDAEAGGAVISPSSAAKRLDSNPLLKSQYLFRVALLQDRLAAASRKQPADEPLTTDPSDTPYAPSELENAGVAWEDEDFANDLELTEEQQILLLEEYEKEITTKKQIKSPQRDISNNNTKQTSTSTKSKTKSAQTRDKLNNKQTTDKKALKNKNGGQKQSPKKAVKDVCGNDLVEDYFGEKDENVKDDDSNSDESWEKEFEIDDVEQKA
ncbi:putative BSD domain-containing protein 1 [Operophtera brumata]|uniref:Putative BSD domain-containing protein 1 n=1 Tax=Operophtera brumata TaxID=104452 RepID=A0A0L7KYB1_OPEBR|nr:putative BSD domain-containing protein 1 [Operophtera brumata]